MATDFFDRQDYARRQTRWLLVLFGLSVAAIVVVVYFAVVMGLAASNDRHFGPSPPLHLWQPLVFLWVAFGTLTVIGLGSFYKIAELSSGGEQIALMLGGRPVDPQTTDLGERRLLNVVEEMSLASGIPVPPVYILDDEQSINAFAAGHQPGDAVVAVSAGCIKYLTRDELQGVVGHEFSHVLNGDMRLNLRLIGITYGILVLAIIGYYTMRVSGDIARGSRKNGAGAAAGVFIVGLGLMILGYLGVFFGRLIKSIISRHREFLADASAVQFTRNPEGIAGALKKIGGLSIGSRICNSRAEEVSHMFFGDAFAGSFFNLFATHPPLETRIKILDPAFDGAFPEVRPVAIVADVVAGAVGPRVAASEAAASAFVSRAAAIDASDMVKQIGRPQNASLQQAAQTVGGMPTALLDAVREPYVAQAVIYAVLLSRSNPATKAKQMEVLQARIEPPLFQHVRQLSGLCDSSPPEDRLPLAALAIPSLKRASANQYVQLRETVDALVKVDGRMDLFEYCLRTVLLSSLDIHFGLATPPAIRYRSIAAVAGPTTTVLSAVAYVGQKEPEAIDGAFQAGTRNLLRSATLTPSAQCTLRDVDEALAELAQAAPTVKRAVIRGVAACLTYDGKVTVEEGELLRAIAAILACPMPLIATPRGESV